MINRIKLIIFDVDGTLVDAYKAIQKSLNFTLKKLDYTQASAYAVRRAVGWGDERFIKTFIKSKDAENGLIIYRRHHKTSLLKNSRVIPKVKNILTILKKKIIN